jgi:hypothetical protein
MVLIPYLANISLHISLSCRLSFLPSSSLFVTYQKRNNIRRHERIEKLLHPPDVIFFSAKGVAGGGGWWRSSGRTALSLSVQLYTSHVTDEVFQSLIYQR